MSESKRPITQLGDFWPTVAGDPSQNLSVTTLPDTQALKRTRVRKNLMTPLDIQASKKNTSVQPNLPPFKTNLYKKNEKSTLNFENENVKQPIEATPPGPYEEYMTLDQAGPAIIGSENTEEPTLVVIKRVKKTNESRFNEIAPFTSDHLVQIRAIYEDGSDAVIVYETMDVTLRQLTGILQGPLKAFQIAAICKEVSYLYLQCLGTTHDDKIAARRSLLYA